MYAAVTPNNLDVVVLVLFSGTCAETFTKKEQERRGARETASGLEKSCKCVPVWRVLSTVGVSLVPCGTLPSSLGDRQSRGPSCWWRGRSSTYSQNLVIRTRLLACHVGPHGSPDPTAKPGLSWLWGAVQGRRSLLSVSGKARLGAPSHVSSVSPHFSLPLQGCSGGPESQVQVRE